MMNITFTGIEASLRAKQSRKEAEERIAKFEQENEAFLAEFVPQEDNVIVEEVIETVSQEDIEFELMTIDTYRDFVLDINEDEVEWINSNIDLSHLIGSNDNTVMTLSKLLNLSVTKVRNMVRSALGYKRGSDYQNTQRQYVDELIEDFRHSLYEDLEKQLKKSRLYDFYRALLDYTKSRVSLKPLSKDEDELTFFVSYLDLRIVCKEFGVNKGIGDNQLLSKLSKLCGLGLLENLSDEQVSDEALEVAYSIAKKQAKDIGVNIEFNRKNFYVLKDLSPAVQDEAIARIKLEAKYGLRSKDKTSTTYALMYGEEEQKKITAQGKVKISDAKLKNFNSAAQALIEKQGYFTEEELRKQFIKIDRNTKKAESYDLTRMYLSRVAKDNNCVKTRVGAKTREKHSISNKIKSNSFVYIPEK